MSYSPTNRITLHQIWSLIRQGCLLWRMVRNVSRHQNLPVFPEATNSIYKSIYQRSAFEKINNPLWSTGDCDSFVCRSLSGWWNISLEKQSSRKPRRDTTDKNQKPFLVLHARFKVWKKSSALHSFSEGTDFSLSFPQFALLSNLSHWLQFMQQCTLLQHSGPPSKPKNFWGGGGGCRSYVWCRNF